MKHKITESENGLDITVNDIKNNKDKLIQAFQECQNGTCSCPTDEYKNLESLNIEEKNGNITLHLDSKEGTTFNQDEINKCLEYTKNKVSKNNE